MRVKTGNGTVSVVIVLAIWSIAAVSSLPGLAVSPILGDLKTIFPHADDLAIQMLTSLPSLMIIPFVLLTGRLSVARDKSRLLVAGLAIFLASGLLYFTVRSMVWLIVLSGVLGIGAGMVIPLSTGLVVDYFTGRYRVRQLGLSSAVNNLTLVIATALAGYLAGINWHLPFLVYTLPAVSLVLALALRRDMRRRGALRAPRPKPGERAQRIEKGHLAQLMGFYFLMTYLALAVPLYLAFLVDDAGLKPTWAGVMIALFFLAIMLPGLAIDRVIDRLRNGVTYVPAALVAIGLVVIGTTRHAAWMAAGCMLCGFGYGVLQPVIYEKTALVAPPRLATLALSFIMSMNYLAILVAPFLVDALRHLFGGASNRFPFLMNAALAGAVAVVALAAHHNFIFGLTHHYTAMLPVRKARRSPAAGA